MIVPILGTYHWFINQLKPSSKEIGLQNRGIEAYI